MRLPVIKHIVNFIENNDEVEDFDPDAMIRIQE